MTTVPTTPRPEHDGGALNPPWSECRCSLTTCAEVDDPEHLHGLLLGLNGTNPLRAMAEVMVVAVAELADLYEYNVLDTIAAEHNWTDPVAVSDILAGLNELGKQCFDLRWLNRIARGQVVPDPRMSMGTIRDILEGIQGKCPWIAPEGDDVATAPTLSVTDQIVDLLAAIPAPDADPEASADFYRRKAATFDAIAEVSEDPVEAARAREVARLARRRAAGLDRPI